MPSLSESYHLMRSILELLYFASGIAVAIGVFWGLEQLKITKQLANINAKREALKFAAERCQYFAESTVPAMTSFMAKYNGLKLTFLRESKWTIQNGEIISHDCDTKVLDSEIPTVETLLVNYLNTMEAFAIPFAAGVADDELGFKETAMAFCQGVKVLMPAFFQMRRKGAARYESTIKLYETWNKRLVVAALSPAMKSLEELVKSVEKEKIKPLGA